MTKLVYWREKFGHRGNIQYILVINFDNVKSMQISSTCHSTTINFNFLDGKTEIYLTPKLLPEEKLNELLKAFLENNIINLDEITEKLTKDSKDKKEEMRGCLWTKK